MAPQSRDVDGGGWDGVKDIQGGGRCLDLLGGEIGLSPTLFYQVGMSGKFVQDFQFVPFHEAHCLHFGCGEVAGEECEDETELAVGQLGPECGEGEVKRKDFAHTLCILRQRYGRMVGWEKTSYSSSLASSSMLRSL